MPLLIKSALFVKRACFCAMASGADPDRKIEMIPSNRVIVYYVLYGHLIQIRLQILQL